MQCQLCNKVATVHLTEIINGKKLEQHLCEQCAQKEGITIKSHVPLSELLNNLVDSQQESQEASRLSCSQCDITWTEFRKGGLLGCPNDYVAFDRPLRAMIEKAQAGAVSHTGRFPRGKNHDFDSQVELLRLRQDLHRAVGSEEYETAAQLRDKIRKLSQRA